MQRLHLIRRCFSRLSKEKLKTLYTSIVRPVLEYGSVVWNPWLKQDINCLENVQRRCQRLCLESLEIESLIEQRKQQDIIEAYKFITRKYKTLTENLFEKPHRQLRGHSWKLFKKTSTNRSIKELFHTQNCGLVE